MTELEARKRALVAESELYRQTLIVDVQNLRLYRLRVERKLAFLKTFRSALLFLPALAPLLGLRVFRAPRSKTRGPFRKVVGTSLFAWRLYRKFGPMLRPLLARGLFRRNKSATAEERWPAGNV